jgi:hypothetical protein
MRFADERYVRQYTRKTVTIVKLGWEGRAVWWALLGEFDRAGIFDLSDASPVEAISLVTEIPEQIVEIGLRRLIQLGVLVHVPAENVLYAPKFMAAQEAVASNKARQRMKRERLKARERLTGLAGLPAETEPPDDDEPDSERHVSCRDDTPRVEASRTKHVTHRVAEKASRAKERHVSCRDDTPRVEATRNDTLKPSLALPSLTDRNVVPTSNLDPNLLGPSELRCPPRAGARVLAPTREAQRALARKHPDEDFIDAVTEIRRVGYEPSQWVRQRADQVGLRSDEFSRALAEYRERGDTDMAPQTTHDRRFKGWLETALKRQNHGGKREEHRGAPERAASTNGTGGGEASGDDANGGERKLRPLTQAMVDETRAWLDQHDPGWNDNRN